MTGEGDKTRISACRIEEGGRKKARRGGESRRKELFSLCIFTLPSLSKEDSFLQPAPSVA